MFQPWQQTQRLARQLGGAIAFYTCLPIPLSWPLEFAHIARWAPLIGLAIGAALGLGDGLLQFLGCPNLTRSALVVSLWIAVTGGLHLDGAMDTADGLAVTEPQRRLVVMADSHAGAFGIMCAIALFTLKTSALSELECHRAIALMTAAGWGRWGQLLAIACYPYLKPTGKGAFHKATVVVPWDPLLGLLFLLGFSGLQLVLWGFPGTLVVRMIVSSGVIAWMTGAWLNFKLGGHTGDTYGAIVEWTETLILCGLVLVHPFKTA